MKRIIKLVVAMVLVLSILPIRVEAASINKKTVTLEVGDTYNIKVSGGKVTKWTSSKPGVASIKDGKVTALNVGSTTITAKTSSGNVKCKVTVKQSSNKKYKKQSYYAGKSFKPGYYVLYNTSDIEKATYAIYDGKEFNIYNTIATDSFKYNAIVEVKEGQTLYMENCYAKEMSEAIVRATGEGTFKVGTHIKAGKYKVSVISGVETRLYVITNSWNSVDAVDSLGLGDNTTVEIEVKNGQYLTLVGCKLINN